MSKYINKDELIRRLTRMSKRFANKYINWSLGSVVEDIIAMIDNLQKEEDVAQVVHARWVPKENIDAVRCSNCSHMFLGGSHAIATFIYCPACGAKMDGENNE